MAQKYRECEYINIQGYNAYFGTGHKITTNTKVQIKFLCYTSGSNWGNVCGDGENSTWRFVGNTGSGFDYYVYADMSLPNNSSVYNFELGNHYIKDLDTGEILASATTKTYSETKTMYIGNNVTRNYPINCNYYSVKLYEGDELIGDYIPVLDSSNNVALYDKVSDSFIYSNGGGSITYKLIPVTKKYDFLGDNIVLTNNNKLWGAVASIDFGGCDVTFSGTMANWSANTTISAVINGKILNTDGRNLFHNDTALTIFDCDLTNLEQGGDSGENGMFEFASKLSAFTPTQMPKLVNSARMFQGCSGLTSFTTDCPSLLTATSMFYSCGNLKDVSANFSALTSGQTMFATDTKLSSFTSDLLNLTYANQMFSACTALTTASLGETTKLNSNLNMFLNCTALTSCSMSLSSITAWNNMFSGCTALKEWNVKDLGIDCSTLLKTAVTSFDYIADNAKTVTDGQWFVMTDNQYDNNADAVATLQGKGWNVYKESNYPQDHTEGKYQIFMSNGSFSLNGKTYSNQLEGINKWVDIDNSVSSMTSLQNAFLNNQTIKKVYVDFCGVTKAIYSFSKCYNLTDFSGDLSSLQIGGSTYEECGTFFKCSALTSFTTTNLNSLTNGYGMFEYCYGLAKWTVDLPNLSYGKSMFSDCNKITEFTVDLPNLSNSDFMFYGCSSLKKIRSNCSAITSNSRMFYRDGALTDMQIWQLPISSGVILYFDSCPINYDSFVYMALNNQEVSAISSDQHLSGCTLGLSTTSKNLSATTDVTKYWNLLEKKGYKISGYTADIEDLPNFVEVRDDATTFEGEGSSDSGSPFVVALTHSLSSDTLIGSVSDGYIQLNNYTNHDIDVVIGSQVYTIEANTNSDVIEVISANYTITVQPDDVTVTTEDDEENNSLIINF